MNRRGFSLVELLGVIVILGVLAIISTPIVTGIIDDSRKSGFRTSLTGMKKAIETDYSDHKFDTSRRYEYEDKKLIETTSGDEVDISGHINGRGEGYITANGIVVFGAYTDSYCGIIEGSDIKMAGEGTFTYDVCKSEVNDLN